MMSSNYTLLFSIVIEHTYYSNEICIDLQYTPSTETQRLMDKYTLRILKTPEGFSFYASTSQSIKGFLNYLRTTDNTTSFSFDVLSMNQEFTVFTAEYPIDALGTISFDSTRTTMVESTNVLQGAFTSSPMSQISFSISIDYDAIIRFRESGNNPKYKILFTARKTQWRYYIINNSNQHFEKLEIQSKSGIQFREPKEVTLQNGAVALMFSSGEMKLPIKEKVEDMFNLLGTKTNLGNTRTQTIISGLPIAKPTSIEIYKEGDVTQVASPLYIYI